MKQADGSIKIQLPKQNGKNIVFILCFVCFLRTKPKFY